jgi:hypothetical protein
MMGKKFKILEEDKEKMFPEPIHATEQDKKFLNVFYGVKSPIEEDHNDVKSSEHRVSNGLASREHRVSNEVASREHRVSKKEHTNPIGLADGLAEEVASREQRVSNEVANSCFERLTGKEFSAFLLIYGKCKMIGSLTTPAIPAEELCGVLKCRANRAKNVIHRLVKKGIISRAGGVGSRGGWSKYSIPLHIYQSAKLSDRVSNEVASREQRVSNEVADGLADGLAGPSSSSSINKTSTGGEIEDKQKELLPVTDKFQLKPEWELVDIEPLSFIGFSKHHLIQVIQQGKLTPDVVQDSIYSFAFDLQTNGRGKGLNSPINFIMGILRRGNPYTPPDNYISPKEQAMRKILEMRKREELVAQELEEAEFRKWLRETADEEKKKIVGDTFGLAYSESTPMALAKLKGVFLEKIYSYGVKKP